MTGNVVKTLRVKAGDGTFPDASAYPIGTEPRYISAIRNSNNNNLEEQLLLGTDCIKTFWYEEDDEDDLCYHTTIEYRKDIENPINFYVMEIRDSFQAGEVGGQLSSIMRAFDDIYDSSGKENRIINIYTVADESIAFTEQVTKTLKMFLPNLGQMYTFSGTDEHKTVDYLEWVMRLQDDPDTLIQEIKLYFYRTKDDEEPLLVAEKQVILKDFSKIIELDHYDSETDTYYFKRVIDKIPIRVYEKIENKL